MLADNMWTAVPLYTEYGMYMQWYAAKTYKCHLSMDTVVGIKGQINDQFQGEPGVADSP